MQCNDTEDEDQRENKNDDGINLQSWRLIGVKSCSDVSCYFNPADRPFLNRIARDTIYRLLALNITSRSCNVDRTLAEAIAKDIRCTVQREVP